jgi:HlyD family secretion protein
VLAAVAGRLPTRLACANQIRKDQLASKADSMRAQLSVQQSLVDQARALLRLTQQQRDELKVRAGLDGMLQLVPVEVGQQVAPAPTWRASRTRAG